VTYRYLACRYLAVDRWNLSGTVIAFTRLQSTQKRKDPSCLCTSTIGEAHSHVASSVTSCANIFCVYSCSAARARVPAR
jgi:hypothetical protein